MTFSIRPEQPADFAAIRAVVAEAFDDVAIADLVEAIRGSDAYRPELALVAVDEHDQVMGHVMIDTCIVRGEHSERRVVMLSPLATSPSRQAQGIGTALIEAAVAAAEQAGEPFVVLEGSPAYYGKRGFVFAGDYGLSMTLPDWAPPEAAQVRLLRSYDADDPTLRGQVVYPAPFDALE